jgi:hypothetical protein
MGGQSATASINGGAREYPTSTAHGITYQRHRPENTLLYQRIQQYLKTFEAQCEAEGNPVPDFAKREFEAFMSAASWLTAVLETTAQTANTTN